MARPEYDTPVECSRCRKKRATGGHRICETCRKMEQLGVMWQYLRFHSGKLSINDIEGLEQNLNVIRQLMIQKTGGQEKYAENGHIDFNDTYTCINNIVVYAMKIFLSGGFDILRSECEVVSDAV